MINGIESVESDPRAEITLVDAVCSNEYAQTDLLRVLQHDYATFTHSTNVAIYASLLGKTLSYDDPAVEQIAVGGLLHDLGKLDIPDRILCKPGKLDEDEFREIKRASGEAFDPEMLTCWLDLAETL